MSNSEGFKQCKVYAETIDNRKKDKGRRITQNQHRDIIPKMSDNSSLFELYIRIRAVLVGVPSEA